MGVLAKVHPPRGARVSLQLGADLWPRQPAIARLTLGSEDESGGTSSDDAALVLARFAQATGADGWALTRSSEQAPAERLAAADLGMTFGSALLRIADRLEPGPGQSAPAPVWFDRLHPSYAAAAMVLPVRRAQGLACTFVNLLFADLDEDRRKHVEAICLDEWPSVAAYFRLWQVARADRIKANGVEAGLNLVAIGILLLSDDGHIAFANDAARLMMERHDGIREYRGQLHATDRGDASALSAMIGAVLSSDEALDAGNGSPLLTLRRPSGPPLVVSIAPAPRPSSASDAGGALLFFVDPGLDIRQLAEPVCKLFRLSRVETELTCLLASGQTLASAAHALHIKVSTARGYLKQIFVKTGSNRQVDLVRLIFSNLVRTSVREHSAARS